MIIRNCLDLLSEISQLEANISSVESLLEQLQVEVNREEVLRLLLEKQVTKF